MAEPIGTLPTDYARVTRPIADTAIATDTSGLVAGEVRVPAGGGDIPAYRAQPASGGPFPIILVIQEIFGVHTYIQDVCRRLAKLGFLALAPELFCRQGDPSRVEDLGELFRDVVSRVPDAQVLSDLDACVAFAESRGDGDPERLSITGFCWGGRIVWLYAAHCRELRAGVAWYGRLVGDSRPTTPSHPLDLAGELHAPVLGLYGGADTGIPLDTVERMRDGLRSNADPSSIVVYPEAPHGFHSDYRPSYRKADAEDGWKRLQSWLSAHGAS